MISQNLRLYGQKYSQTSKQLDKKLLKIPIKSVDEGFFYLPELCKKYRVVVVFSEKEKPQAFLRKSVAIALMQAAKHFNQQGLTLKVESAHRSLINQKKLFLKRFALMKKKYPEKSKLELLTHANTYTAGIPVLAAHTAGAAVDVTLLNNHNVPLDFGTFYPQDDKKSATEYSNLSKIVKKNRKILKEGMEEYGLINYPFEWWHFSKGDVCAAYLKKQKKALYGPVNFDPKTNKIEYVSLKDCYSYFKV